MADGIAGLLGGSPAAMSPEEEQRLLMQMYSQSMAGGAPPQMPPPPPMPAPTSAPASMPAYQPQMQNFQNFAPADAYGSQFERSLAYQSALPSLLQPFNPAAMPPIYPQVAVDPYRLDIRNIELPEWLKAAIARENPAAAATAPASSGRAENVIEH